MRPRVQFNVDDKWQVDHSSFVDVNDDAELCNVIVIEPDGHGRALAVDGLVHGASEPSLAAVAAPASVPDATTGGAKKSHTFEWGRRCKAPPSLACSVDGWKLHEMTLTGMSGVHPFATALTDVTMAADDKKYVVTLELPTGEHLFKFRVDSEFKVDFAGKIGVDDAGDIANVVTIE